MKIDWKQMLADKAFFRKTAMIAVPIAIQGLLNNMLNFIDTLMIGKLGETTIAAVGLANKVFFVLTLLLFGICSGSGILSSQYWGVRDIKSIHKVLGIGMVIGLVSSVLFTALSIIAPETVMRVFTNSEEAARIGAVYLRIVCISYPLTAVTQIFIASLRSVNDVKVPVIISTIAIFVNVGLNYALIFGKFGFPVLGVKGAAIATLTARVVECLSIVLIVYRKKSPVAAKIKEMLSFDRKFLRRYFKTVSPVIMNELFWGVGITMYSLVYGRMGDNATAAITVTQSIEQIFQVVFMGISNATAIILGNELGAGKLEEAKKHAAYLIRAQFIFAIITLVVCYFVRKPVISVFGMSYEVEVMIERCFYVYLVYLIFKVFNYVMIVGVLRSGGDTKSAMLIDIGGVWLIGIPMAVLGGLVLKLPIYYVYAMVTTEEIFKFVLGLRRYRQQKWIRNIITEQRLP